MLLRVLLSEVTEPNGFLHIEGLIRKKEKKNYTHKR